MFQVHNCVHTCRDGHAHTRAHNIHRILRQAKTNTCSLKLESFVPFQNIQMPLGFSRDCTMYILMIIGYKRNTKLMVKSFEALATLLRSG